MILLLISCNYKLHIIGSLSYFFYHYGTPTKQWAKYFRTFSTPSSYSNVSEFAHGLNIFVPSLHPLHTPI